MSVCRVCGCTCSHLRCVCTCMHTLMCVHIQYIYTSVSMCLYVCLHMGFVQAQRVFNSSKCGCVFIHTDAVWWCECQHCSRLSITVCYLSCFVFFFLLIGDSLIRLTTFVCLCLCVETLVHWAYMEIQRTIIPIIQSRYLNIGLIYSFMDNIFRLLQTAAKSSF